MHGNTREDRINIVGNQYKVELDVIKKAQNAEGAAAVFVVPSRLTPMHIDPNLVIPPIEEGELFTVEDLATIPEGLMTADKLYDPERLSTVLARVLSFRDMLEAGVDVHVFYFNAQRPRSGAAAEFVDDTSVNALIDAYPNLHCLLIDQATYNTHVYGAPEPEEKKPRVCAANYCYGKADQHTGIDATQANTTAEEERAHDWAVHRKAEPVAQAKFKALNQFLETQLGDKMSIQALKAQSQLVPAVGASTSATVGAGAAAAAATTSSAALAEGPAAAEKSRTPSPV